MSADLWAEVATRCDAHAYMVGVERTVERVRATGEVFTPTALVIEMIRGIPLESFAPGKTVLDPACGDGQFLVAAKWVKVLFHGMSEDAALADIYGVDIMRDNVDLCRRRLGGGTIVMGNTLDPLSRLEGQTEEEHLLMRSLFAHGEATIAAKKRPFHERRTRSPRGRMGLETERPAAREDPRRRESVAIADSGSMTFDWDVMRQDPDTPTTGEEATPAEALTFGW